MIHIGVFVFSYIQNSRNAQSVASLFAGMLSSLAFAPYHLIISLPISISILLLLLELSNSHKHASLTSWCYGFGHFLSGLLWIQNALLVDGGKFAWLIPFSAILIPGVLALYFALMGLLSHKLLQNKRISIITKVFLFSILWVLCEYLRGHLFTGFPWNLLGYSLAFSNELLQMASIFGIYGMSFLTILFSITPYVWVKSYKIGIIFTTVIFSFIAFAYTYGYYRLHNNPTKYSNVKVRLVQPNIPQLLHFDVEFEQRNLAKLVEMSSKDNSDINAVIWPEGATIFYIDQPGFRNIIRKAAPKNGVLILGADLIEYKHNNYDIWNSIHVIDHTGTTLAHYNKIHLVPFGEYVPLSSILPIDKIVAGQKDFSPGKEAFAIDLTDKQLPAFRPLICYESIFPEEVRAGSSKFEWLLNITNDAWYGNSNGPYQHLQISRLRAIEQGTPMIRVAKNGVSAIIDSYGRVMQTIPLNIEGVIDALIPQPIVGRTLYSKLF